ncbi:MAG: T9SS type A sorting domain-containing protein [Saprospiraceae bacterium]|nr:T9SS type A sorting domain-containing protein [Saprospiraceae bacterium]HMW38405.1 T9SS type A sorting domain-containing protein [Saprospiraceae bacterium]HMX87301.1 T9SS type A sorting domain-containing protein [Saprospiraceae bacterium]HMZ39128.1 T9SS type A sorting domain-containing protein [Saprospiraceae bacterium]HNA63301.1 T9SS type A sorting domain-containing protein [Saprospiraceae bacterium]
MKIVKILIVCLINLQAYAQIVEFQGHQSGGNPWNRRIDTVTFGFSAGAKLGIDEAYGEENVKNRPIDSLELRIFQRTKLTYNCLEDTSNNKIYFPVDLELRKDIRSLNSTGDECYFEVVNLTNNFTEGYVINLTKYHTPTRQSTYFGFNVVSECGTKKIQYSNALKDIGSTYICCIVLFPGTINDTDFIYYKYFHFHLKPENSVNLTEEDSIDSLLKAYPNPANNYITIECEEATEILDLNSKKLFSFPKNEKKRIVDLSLLPSGTYIIAKINPNGTVGSHIRFTKI